MSVTSVILPKLGLTMDEGRVVAWVKREGDRVEAGDVLFEVETDKATMEVESPVAGYLRKVLVEAGEDVPVTTVVALVATTVDEPVAVPEATTTIEPPPAPEAAAHSPAPPAAPAAESERIVASPAARKRAKELGVDLSQIRPSRGTRISIDDVEVAHAAGSTADAAMPARAAPPAAGDAAAGPALSRMRRAIAERMTHSFRDVPQFSVAREVDMTSAAAARIAANVSYTDVLISVVARTLRDHPRLMMRYDPAGLVAADGVHIGIAVALDDGLLVPVLRDADRKELAEIKREREALQAGARAGRLPAEALSDGVFTISNLGQQGVDRFTAIVNPPEAAILAVGRVRDLAMVRDGAVVVAPVVSLTLSVDHRVVDGAPAAAFLADLADRLERGLS